jgi:alkanesulfonate monooxygenase SsuD/methylene tetrahydromethanopterin reductase-like flavin-dependent oxidoreductase (luciferase family)
MGRLPILIGGKGEKVTLRLVAEHADSWNSFGPPEDYERLSGILDEWCTKVGRDPSEIERTVVVDANDIHDMVRYVDAGAEHVIVGLNTPFDLAPLASLIEQRDALA